MLNGTDSTSAEFRLKALLFISPTVIDRSEGKCSAVAHIDVRVTLHSDELLGEGITLMDV